ncbi:PEP-CTERM sorting domain-containing protein [Roseibacillus ishigakijimensis]|uniref:PEP-CTERM sorting domain-containing protein n=1 Tax=Roseibacillus ishigakijimensis TaxID=454146 RepID=A0A934RSE6_9BACT|nr:PEP-CTERM sorting domain-containing protein [Roseibacillus ishigakijimensis]MBK1833370.1 PEP-CTERM sorting domain-containing protein [Roseibacillus ishigakijimensis]
MSTFFKNPAILFLLAATPLSALTVQNFSHSTNNRFANRDPFVLAESDLSGVGRATNNTWATLVSSNVFVSSNHYHPAIGQTVTFHASNNANGQTVTIPVTDGQRIGNSDVWVGILESSAPSDYATYTIASEPFAGETTYLLGRSPSKLPSLTDVAVGENSLSGSLKMNGAGSEGNALYSIYDKGANALAHEALVQNGDSGAPLFLQDPISGELTLAGTNWLKGSFFAVGEFSAATKLSDYEREILRIVEDNRASSPPLTNGLLGSSSTGLNVPEPSSAFLLCSAVGMALSFRVRK